ncbi:hypothetical protein AB0M97_18270 [Streptomyces sp. NPDC051207]|uniref:hypothetical protein n=1 Tax=Streptomyces sp. NPDC051207 TaxID=3154641 RepID=UPI003425EDD9
MPQSPPRIASSSLGTPSPDGALLALAPAVCYGVVDFVGGLLSGRVSCTAVTFLGQVGGLLLACLAALLVPAGAARPADLMWGALPGVDSGTAWPALDRGWAGAP